MNRDIRKRIRYLIPFLPAPSGYFRYKGFFINEGLAVRTGAPKPVYAYLARLHGELLRETAPVERDHFVLEAGCGSGMDAILLTRRLSRRGRYAGFDIDKPSVDWCIENISRRYPNFHFFHFDIQNSTYNPEGALSPLEVSFPAEDSEVDRFIAQSVFTHLLPDVAGRYLREIRRVLRADGLAVITAFIGELVEIEASVESTGTHFSFPHRYASGVYISDPEKPSDGVAYEHSKFRQMVQDAGLKIGKYLPGYWAPGRENRPYGQDVIVLSQPE